MRDRIVHGYRVFDADVGHHIKNWRKRFFPHDLGLPRKRNDRRAYVKRCRIFRSQDAFAAKDLAALVARAGKRGLHPLEGVAVDQRPDQGLGFERVPDPRRGVGALQSRKQGCMDGFVNDEPSQMAPGWARTHRGNCRLFDTGRRNLARDRLFAGGNRIRTSGTAEDAGLVADLINSANCGARNRFNRPTRPSPQACRPR